ncbi:MAG: FAD-binding oxidoreductase [Alphaproteobacteria bacterium]|nr:FAD-binding oxidoreductase [Alphaproteobacteria bacterium]
MHWYQVKLTSRARTHSCEAQICRPENIDEIPKVLEQVGKNGIIARGMGNSYADQTLNNGGAVMVFDHLDRIRSFDENTGELVCEPGITIGKISEIFYKRGFMFPVVAGSGKRTLGAAIAGNILGMNTKFQHSLVDSINWVDVVLANGKVVRASWSENSDLLSAIVGGQGLVGFISLVSINLPKIPSKNLHVIKNRYNNLDKLLLAMKDARKNADFTVAWLDSSAKGNQLGRGILTTMNFTEEKENSFYLPKFKGKCPDFMSLLDSLPVIKTLRYQVMGQCDKIVSFDKYIYPSDRFGVSSCKNVCQLRLSVPEAEGPQALRRILTEISATEFHVGRAVLQLVEKNNKSLLAFSTNGYSLSLDFVRKKGLNEFLQHLEMIVFEWGGKIALCNDSLMTLYQLERMYPRLKEFIQTRKKYDPNEKFVSDFSRRIFQGE